MCLTPGLLLEQEEERESRGTGSERFLSGKVTQDYTGIGIVQGSRERERERQVLNDS